MSESEKTARRLTPRNWARQLPRRSGRSSTLGAMRLHAHKISAPEALQAAETATVSPAMSTLPEIQALSTHTESVSWLTERLLAWFPRLTRDGTYRRLVILADALAACIAVLLSAAAGGWQFAAHAAVGIPLVLLLNTLVGVYDRGNLLYRSSAAQEIPALLALASLVAGIVAALGLLAASAENRGGLITLWLSLFACTSLLRVLARATLRNLTPPERCLVIGDVASCSRVQSDFDRSRWLHSTVVGGATPSHGEPDPGVRVGDEDLRGLVARLRAERIIVTGADRHEVTEVIDNATSLGLEVSLLPNLLELVGAVAEADGPDGMPLLSIHPLGLTRSLRVMKRWVDVVGGAVLLLVLSPVLGLISAAIVLDSGRPVLFRQRRIGRDGREFQMLKFRTMVPNAEERKHELGHLNEADGLFKIARDPRITRLGRLLRRTSLDELPQLVNVLRGEMSLVGPRPLIAEEDSLLEGWRRWRLHLKPGMTGPWQVRGSSRVPLADMARLDYLYLANWSLWLDVKILARTVPYVLFGRGL